MFLLPFQANLRSNTMSISVEVDRAMQDLLQHEDTDHDGLITVDDQGPKVNLFNFWKKLVTE